MGRHNRWGFRGSMLALGCMLGLAGRAQGAVSLGNVQEWIGSGSNQAGFEIDFGNGRSNSALYWGYRWDGTATGEQMLDAIAATDPRLYALVSGTTQFGTALFGLGYHASGTGTFNLSPSLTFDANHLATATYSTVVDGRTAVDANDQWQEGWLSAGYWSYWRATDAALTTDGTAAWGYSDVGMSTRVLANGDWDGWSFYNYTTGGDVPSASAVAVTPIASVPEPTVALALVVFAAPSLVRRRRQA